MPGRTLVLLGWLAAGALLAGCGDDDPAGPDDPEPTPNLPPEARFTVDATEGPAPLEVTFDAGTSTDPDGEIVSYRWDFGDGEEDSGRVTTHTYLRPGYFRPLLEVTDDRGSTDTEVGSPILVTAPPGDGDGTIHGVVWHDRRGDGARSPEDPGVPGAVVFLDEDGDGALDPGEVFTVTDAEGRYAFTGVDTTRSHTVTQSLALGWSNTFAGEEGASPSSLEPAAGSPARIIGGTVTGEGELPFMVALLRASDGSFFCGGAFIASSWILTAAHCVDENSPVERSPGNLEVLVGTRNRQVGGERVGVRTLRIFPAFAAQSFAGNDIALVELERAFLIPRTELQTRARVEASRPGTLATAAGWGRTSSGGSPSDELRKVELEIISNAECQRMLDENIVESTICAGTLGGARSVCSGDSGGPLAVRDGALWVQVGITSFGAFTCQPPMAFARVSELVEWVRGVVPPEPSRSVEVGWSRGDTARVDFGNFK